MSVHNLDRIFRPERIALFGANENPASVGCTVLRNLVGAGFRGVVYPVHPTLEAIQGIHCYADASSLPRRPDLAVVCSAAASVPEIVRQCGDAGILGLVIISAGFREAGPDGARLEEELAADVRRYPGMRVVGPNCLGIIIPRLHLNVSFATGMPREGHVTFISQSGALCTSILDWALEEQVGFAQFVSIGNMLDVEFADLIDYFGESEESESIILYIESLKSARRFMTAARAFARTKPIVAYKAGRFAESARAAGSHTGAMAGEDAVFQAAFERAGIARVFEIGEVFDCAELVARYRAPRGPRLAIVTNGGGPGVMATDALVAAGGELAELSPESLAALDRALPPVWSHGNPVDVLGDARPKRMGKAVEIALADPGVDAVLAILTPQAMTNPTGTARVVTEIAAGSKKPILAAWLGGLSMREGIRLLNEKGIATYATPEQAVRAFMTLVAYARNLESLQEVPRDLAVEFSLDRAAVRRNFEALMPERGDTLSEIASKALLSAYGIPVAEARAAATASEAAGAAAAIGYPVVLKVLSPDITHKTDVGGVELDIRDEAALRAAFERIQERARAANPAARLDGVSVQPMVRERDAVELILGMKKDATFGSVILAGTGGTAAEVFGDSVIGFPPLSERLARRMLESLRSWPLLAGYRGRTRPDLDRLLETMIRFSYLVADFPEIREMDVNPLVVSPRGVVALDARVIVDRGAIGKPMRPYAHLALRPYPEEYVRKVALEDGGELLFRPIRPEDEPRWMEMLAACSRETIYTRFRGHFRWDLHENATRYCYIDYDREVAIVAELEAPEGRRLVGVGRLIADPDLRNAEYAVLVADAWQNRGLGGLLTDYCLEIARRWGVERVVAETSTDNLRMLKVFERRDFARLPSDDDTTVFLEKILTQAAHAS